MARLKQIGVKLNGRDTDIPAYYIYDTDPVQRAGSYIKVSDLLIALGLADTSVIGRGTYVEIKTGKAAIPAPKPKPLAGRRIAISAAHGNGRNVSQCNPAYNESDFVLAAALELEQMLIADGAIVHLPRRERKEDMTLQERSRRIDAFGADICIELHTDSFGTGCTDPRGIHIIRQVSRPGDPLAQLLLDEIANATGLPKSARGIWYKEGQPGYDWFHMLRVPHAHNVMIECGFHSNKHDLEFLMSPGAPRLVAAGIRNALVKFMAGK